MADVVKVTKKMVLEAIAGADLKEVDFGPDVTAEHVISYCKATLAQLDAKAAKAKEKAAEKKAANDELKEVVASVITNEYQTVDEIVAQIEGDDVTRGKVVNRLTALLKDDYIVKGMVKVEDRKITAYKLNAADAM